MKNSNIVVLHAIVLALLMLDTLIIQHPVMDTDSSSISLAKTSNSYPSNPPLNAIFKQVEDSVVQITHISQTSENVSNSLAENITLGSGFVYDKQGHIITSYRVIGNNKIVDVTFVDGNRYTAKMIGADIYNDIAVLQIIQNDNTRQQQPLPLPALKPLVIGNSSKLEVGDPVIAIGNPFGLTDSIITGVVSKIESVVPDPVLGFDMPNVILTDIPINPGNSGGPLLNMQGEAVGINIGNDLVGTFLPDPVLGFANHHLIKTEIPIDFPGSTASFSGLGFAIPSSTITRIVPSLIEKGTYVHPYLGLVGVTLTPHLAENITGIPAANFKGIYVDTITKNGPADKAGLHGSTTDQYSLKHGGDIIVAVDGHNVTKTDDLTSYIDLHKSVGNNVILSVYRDGHTLNLKTTLTSRPSSPTP